MTRIRRLWTQLLRLIFRKRLVAEQQAIPKRRLTGTPLDDSQSGEVEISMDAELARRDRR
jgi:hypothetical protein